MSCVLTLLPDLPIRCFSELANIRCRSLSTPHQIGSFIPIVVLVTVLPFLLISTYRLPRATLLLLAIEIILQLGTHAWNLGFWLERPRFANFRSTDTALAVASATPILIYLLALTSHFLNDIRVHLPYSLQGRVSSVAFAVVVAPLVPLAYAASLLGGFVFVRHRSIRGVLFLEFADEWEEWVNVVLSSIGTIAALTYILIISLLALIPLLHPPSSYAYLTTAPSLRPFALSTLSIILSGAETALGLVPLDSIAPSTASGLIILRSCLVLISRVGLIAGLVVAYRQSEAMRRRKSAIFVSGPMRGTFRKMDEGGTREFYGVHGVGREGVSTRVMMRPPGIHAPKLSFTSSAFAAFGASSPLPRSAPLVSPTDPSSSRRAPAGKTMMNLGSIYAPRRVTVDALDMAQWPPPPARSRPESGTLPEGTPEEVRGGEVDPFANPVASGSGTTEPIHPSLRPMPTFSISPTPQLSPQPTASPHASTPSRPPPALVSRTNSRRKPVPHRLSPPDFIRQSSTSTPSSRTRITPRHTRQFSSSTDTPTSPISLSSYADSSTVARQTLFYATPRSSPTASPAKGEYLAPGSFDLDRNGEREGSWGQAPESMTLPRDSASSLGRNRYGGPLGGEAIMASLARLREETGMRIEADRLARDSGISEGESSMSGMGTVGTRGKSMSGGSGGAEQTEGGGYGRGVVERFSMSSEMSDEVTPKAMAQVFPGAVDGHERGRPAWWADARIW